MNESEKSKIRDRIRKKTRKLREAIAAKGLIALGSLHTRTKVCGRKSCPCATDPERRHGPYHEWTRLEDGRLAHTILSDEQVELFSEAIENYRDIQALVEHWQRETVSELLSLRKRKGQR